MSMMMMNLGQSAAFGQLREFTNASVCLNLTSGASLCSIG